MCSITCQIMHKTFVEEIVDSFDVMHSTILVLYISRTETVNIVWQLFPIEVSMKWKNFKRKNKTITETRNDSTFFDFPTTNPNLIQFPFN